MEKYEEVKRYDLLDISFDKHRNKRSLDANSYLHVMLNKLARCFTISDEEMKIKMNLAYGTIARDESGKILGAKVPKGTNMQSFYPYSKWYKEEDGCDCYMFYKRTHELNTKEFSQLLSGVLQDCKESGIETLDDIQFKSLMDDYEKKYQKRKGEIC